MARSRAARPPTRSSPLPAGESNAIAIDRLPSWPALLVIVSGALVFFGALGYFFAQDDFAGLARASGVLPRLDGLWRYVSGQLYFDLMWRVAGLHAWAYHLVSLLAHLGCAALLFHLIARRMSRPAALFGATLFVTHPGLYTALYSISGIGEILSLLFALAALRLAVITGPWRWAALPAFALSLLSKESTLLLPLALVLGFAVLPRERGAARRIGWAALILAAAYAAYYIGADVFRVGDGLPGSAAYALGDAADMGRNLLTYLGWTLNVFLPTVRDFGNAVDPAAFPWGIALAIIGLVGLISPTLRSRGWGVALITYLLFLVPVLPLKNHTYHYYLYAPLAAAGWAAAGAFDGLLVTRLGWRAGMATATAAALVLALNGALVVRNIERTPFVKPAMRAEPTVDRARIARNVFQSLRGATLPAGTRLEFWSPALMQARSDSQRLTAERYWVTNVRSALLDGIGVRVMDPRVAEVAFADTLLSPPMRDRSADFVAVFQAEGILRVSKRAEVDSLLRVYPP